MAYILASGLDYTWNSVSTKTRQQIKFGFTSNCIADVVKYAIYSNLQVLC